MQLTSSAFSNAQPIPPEYTCDTKGTRPPLSVAGVPPGAKSLALIVDDPDAPFGTWTHWTVWNMPTDTKQISSSTLPAGAVEGLTSWGISGWGAPCPPNGVHRYFFKLYAFDIVFSLPASTTAEQLAGAMKNHIVSQAELMGTYTRKK